MAENDPIYVVMVPRQRDGLGEWIEPEVRASFSSEMSARNWAKNWVSDHVRWARVYRCVPIVQIEQVERPPAQFIERTISDNGNP
jgi:hypothetical protein